MAVVKYLTTLDERPVPQGGIRAWYCKSSQKFMAEDILGENFPRVFNKIDTVLICLLNSYIYPQTNAT